MTSFCHNCHSCYNPCGRSEGWNKLNIAFVIGNGVSRKDFNLSNLVGKGKITICNETFKEFSDFDIIASVDGSSTINIRNNCNLSGKTHAYKWHNNYLTGKDGEIEDHGQLIGSYNSGQLALRATIEIVKPDIVYMLGIDLGGIRLYTGKVSGPPTNKCEDTWNKWKSKAKVISVPQDLPYSEFCETLSIR